MKESPLCLLRSLSSSLLGACFRRLAHSPSSGLLICVLIGCNPAVTEIQIFPTDQSQNPVSVTEPPPAATYPTQTPTPTPTPYDKIPEQTSDGWQTASLTDSGIDPTRINNYGYLWWSSDVPMLGSTIHSFAASGAGSQVIAIFPRLNKEVVITGGNYDNDVGQPFQIMEMYILPATLGY